MTGLDEVRLTARLAAERMHATPRLPMASPLARGSLLPLPHYSYSGRCPPVHSIDARVTGLLGRSCRRLLELKRTLQLSTGLSSASRAGPGR